MLRSKFIAIIGGAFALSLPSSESALAQSAPGYTTDSAAQSATAANESSDRASRQERSRRRTRQTETVAPTAEELVASAQAVATATGLDCQITAANLLGVTQEQHSMYEASCATGPGYILIASTPPQTADCVLLAGQADIARARDPEAAVGRQCLMPANQNAAAVVAAYAAQAGIRCSVDEGAAIGRTDEGNVLYEVGCDSADGYWIEKAGTAWSATGCWELVDQPRACKFSTTAESNRAWKTILAGTDAVACDVAQSRRIGNDAAGLAVYEVKCAAGDGFLARVGSDRLARQVHRCSEAAHIGGGCQIGVTAAPASETTTTPSQN